MPFREELLLAGAHPQPDASRGVFLNQGTRRSCARASNVGVLHNDLRASPVFLDQAALGQVLRDGVRLGRGMPVFPEFTDEQLTTLTHYIRKMAGEAKPAPMPPSLSSARN